MMQAGVMHFSEEGNTIRANPFLETLRSGRSAQVFSLVILLALPIFLFVTDGMFKSGSSVSGKGILYTFVFLFAMNGFSLLTNIRQTRYWKEIERRRFAAVREHRTLYNTERPTLLAEPAWQAGTLKLRFTKNFWLRMVGIVFLMAFLLAGEISLWTPLLFSFNTFLVFPILFCIITTLFLVFACILLLYSLSRQKIEPTEYGLTTAYTGKPITIMWNEARLFAFYDTPGLQESGASITYELSSAREIVRWIWVQRKAPFASHEPIDSQDEYNRQMQGLVALVQERTSLPLYDLRQMGER